MDKKSISLLEVRIKSLPVAIRPYIFDIKRIIEKFIGFENVSAILLFGSYARGEFTKNSDVDILIILKDEFMKKKKASFFTKLERIFLATEQKNKLKHSTAHLINRLLVAVEKSTGMFVSHFLCSESDWYHQRFHKIFGVNKVLSKLLAPGDIVLKNMHNSYIPLYNDMPPAKFRDKIHNSQMIKSLLMNFLLSTSAVLIFPIWKNSIKYSMESFKWSLRNSYLYLFDKPASLKNIMDFYSEIALKPTVFSRFSRLRNLFKRDLAFAVETIYYTLKIHLVSIIYYAKKKRK
ncbi:MAG: nucleotidyltransferase domain-containing protein [Promethearchaeota archaeon]